MVLWDGIAHSMVDTYGHFRETCCFCLQVALGLLNWHIFQRIHCCCCFVSVIIRLVRGPNNCSHEARYQMRDVWPCIFTSVLLALYYRLVWSAGGKIFGEGETNLSVTNWHGLSSDWTQPAIVLSPITGCMSYGTASLQPDSHCIG